ncbi:MAG TPA: fatty acid desaturase [Chthoniobacteraceae bacterium]|jgi:fatty acid desaturase|nr:fatty acid desaturase [Chthoniobacteraceae bacterium]
MSAPTTAENKIEPHEPHWISRAAFPVLTGLFFLSQFALGIAVYRSNYWLAVPLVLISSHLMHGMLIGFHEASHGMLRKSRVLNEIDGMIIGVLSLMSFSLYRAAHQSHHAYLGTERDEELWPFVVTTMPRWARVLSAILELTFGLFFTPYLFIRTFLRKDSPIRNKRLRRRIWQEFALTAFVWTALLITVAVTDTWKYFLWLHLIPAWIAANAQSVRKYIEHVGLTGPSINSATRNIVADNWAGKLVSFTLLHEPFHGVHHRHSGLPHAELPMYASELAPAIPEERAPFRSYTHAFWDLLKSLPDPRVGAQWRGLSMATRREMVRAI